MIKLKYFLILISLVACENHPKELDKIVSPIIHDSDLKTEIFIDTVKLDEKGSSLKQPSCCNGLLDIEFKFLHDSLCLFMQRAKSAKGEAKTYYELKFFCAFPNSFDQMFRLFGGFNSHEQEININCNTKSGAYIDRHILNDKIGFFNELQSIPRDEYFSKYFRICIGGEWHADDIQEGFGIAYRVIKEPEAALLSLKKFSDTEIESIFNFIFDSIHPNNDYDNNLFNELKSNFTIHDVRIDSLMTKAFTEVINSDKEHIH
ncbi:MAG: hypothetical protein ACPGLV_11685 [Bacteroidia bacterium]